MLLPGVTAVSGGKESAQEVCDSLGFLEGNKDYVEAGVEDVCLLCYFDDLV